MAFLRRQHVQSLRCHTSVVVQQGVAVPLRFFYPLPATAQGFEFTLGDLASFCQLRQFPIQPVVGHAAFGGEPLVGAPLLVHLGKLLQPHLSPPGQDHPRIPLRSSSIMAASRSLLPWAATAFLNRSVHSTKDSMNRCIRFRVCSSNSSPFSSKRSRASETSILGSSIA